MEGERERDFGDTDLETLENEGGRDRESMQEILERERERYIFWSDRESKIYILVRERDFGETAEIADRERKIEIFER